MRQTKQARSAPKTGLIIYSSLKTSQYKQFIVRPGLQLAIHSIFISQIDLYCPPSEKKPQTKTTTKYRFDGNVLEIPVLSSRFGIKKPYLCVKEKAALHNMISIPQLVNLSSKRPKQIPAGGGVRHKMTKICSLTGSHLYFSFVPLS